MIFSNSIQEEKHCSKTLYIMQECHFDMAFLICEQDIINTYPENEIFSCKKYFEYLKLIQENPFFGYKRCAKILQVPQGRIRWWHTKGPRTAIPLALKTVEKLKEAGLIPFTAQHKHAKIIFNILGTLFGDGGIDKRLNTAAFSSSNKKDIDLWANDLQAIFPFAKNKLNLIEGGEYGHSYNIRCFDRAVIRFFVALGGPIGDKVATKYFFPNYIFCLSRGCKIAFLDGLLASEMSVPVFRDSRWRNSKHFTNFELGLSKIEPLDQDHKIFLMNLKKLSHSVGLTCTPNLKKSLNRTIRKDGFRASCYRIFFQTHFEKIINFNKVFPLRYSQNKKERLQKEIENALEFKSSKLVDTIVS